MTTTVSNTTANGRIEHYTTENTPLLQQSSTSENAGLRFHSKLFWHEVLMISRLSLPIFGLNIMEYSLIVVSVFSLGHLSTAALAAVTLGEMTVNVTGFSVIIGFASALDTLLPSAWTSEHPQLVGLWSQRMMVVTTVALIPILAIWMNSESILLLLRQEPEVARLASAYIRWMAIGLPAFAYNMVARRYFMCQGKICTRSIRSSPLTCIPSDLFTVPTYIIIAVAPMNALLNYLFVWGPEWIRLGFVGSPLATVSSFYLISIAYTVYGAYYAPKRAWHPISRYMFHDLRLIVKLGLAGVGQTASEWWAWDVLALIASQLGSEVVLAAQSVLVVSSSLTWQAPFAISIAASIRIGNLLGERDATRAGLAAKAAVSLGLAVAGIFALMLMTFRSRWSYLFNEDPEVAAVVVKVLPLVALFQVFDATGATTSGILRAMGKQVLGALVNLSCYYGLGIPLGAFLAFKWKFGLEGLWIGITAALVLCSLFGVLWTVITPHWNKEVLKVVTRLEEGKASMVQEDGEDQDV